MHVLVIIQKNTFNLKNNQFTGQNISYLMCKRLMSQYPASKFANMKMLGSREENFIYLMILHISLIFDDHKYRKNVFTFNLLLDQILRIQL